MTFEPVKVLHSVLEFYYSSGIVYVQDKPVEIGHPEFVHVQGQKQKYEQLLFFIFGHLLPEFAPLHLDLSVSTQSDEHSGGHLKTVFNLPPTSKASADALHESFQADERLSKLNAAAESRWIFDHKDSSRASISLFYPISGIVDAENEPAIDFNELKQRYDNDEMAFTLLEGFVMNVRRHLALLSGAAERGEWTEAHRHAHALKGGALNVVADSFAQKAKIIEQAIKEQRYDEVPVAIEQLERSCTELESAWAAHREELSG